MAIKPIQTIEGGPEYDHWATADQMERLIKSLMTSGISQADAKNLTSLLEDIDKGGKVDTQVLRQVLGNLKTTSRQDKVQTKATEQQDKAERSFWQKSSENAQNATRAFQKANLADALKQTRDLGMIPIASLSDAFTRVTSIVSSFGKGIFSAANSIIKSFGKIGAGIGKVLGFIGGIIASVGGVITTAIGALLGAVDGMGDVFFTLYNTGINMAFQQGKTTSGLGALAQAAANARMTIGEFGEFIAENSRIAVAIGVEAMGELSNTVRKAMIPMGMLGLSMAETNEYMADWLEMSRMTNTLDLMDRAKQAQGTQDYLILLTQLSKITGKRRDQIAAELKEQAQDPDFQSWIQGIPEAIRDQVAAGANVMRTWFGQFGPEFGADITKAMVTPGGLAVTKLGESLIQAGFDQEVAAMQNLLDANKRGEISEKEMLAKLNMIKKDMINNKGATQRMHELTGGMSDVHHRAQKLTTSMLQSGDATDRQTTKLDAMTAAMGAKEELFKSLTQTWTNFLASIFTNPLFTKAMNDLADQFTTIMAPDGSLSKNLEKLATAAGGSLITGLKAISDHVGTAEFASIMATLPDLFAALGTALKGAVTYLRDLFFNSEDAMVQSAHPDHLRKGKKYTLKSGGEIMDGLKESFASLWATMTNPTGVIVTSLVKGFDTLGEYMVEPITNIMVAAFSAIGQMLKDAIRDTIAKILPKWLGGPDTSEVNDLNNELAAKMVKLRETETRIEEVAVLKEIAEIKAKLRTAESAPAEQMSGGQIITTTAAGALAYGAGKKVARGSKAAVDAFRGTTTTVATATETTLKNADEALETTLKKAGPKVAETIGKATAKSLIKKIPVVSVIAGFAFGINRLMEGDLAGAGMEVASGLMGTIPIIGTAGSLSVDAALLARDLSTTQTAPTNTAPVAAANANKIIRSVEHGTGEGSVAEYQLSAREALKKEEELISAKKQEAKWLKRGKESKAVIYTEQIKQLEKELGITAKIEEKQKAAKIIASVKEQVTGSDISENIVPGSKQTIAEAMKSITVSNVDLLKAVQGLDATMKDSLATVKTGNANATTSANKLKAAILESSVYVR